MMNNIAKVHYSTGTLARSTRSSSRRPPDSTTVPLPDIPGLSPVTDLNSEDEFEEIAGPSSAAINKPRITAPHPPDTTDSDSDSDSLINPETLAPPSKMPTESDIAVAQYANITQPPVLTAGKITPKAIMLFQQNCLDYFANAKGGVPNELKVPRILSSFRDVEVLDWIASDRDRLSKIEFSDFMQELRRNFLPRDWEETIRTEILSSKLTQNKGFQDWARGIIVNNCVLRGTDSHFSNDSLRNTLEANMGTDLRILAKETKANEVKPFKEWLELMETVDAKRRNDAKRQREYADEAVRNASAKRHQPHNNRSNRTFGSTSAEQNSATVTMNRCPRLTTEEKDLLSAHKGCFKCRRFYQSHTAGSCTNDFPAAEHYRTRTLEDALRAQRSSSQRGSDKGKQNSLPAKPTTSKAAAATISAEPDENTSLDSTNENAVYALFGPTASSSVLGNGSFSDGDASVSPPSLRSKHYIWKCKTDGPAVEFPVTVSALIDNGAHLVLIRPQLVAQLGLALHQLKEPELVDVAIDSSNKKKEPKQLTHYVRLCVSSLDNSFVSRTVYAIVAPGLCMPIILGLPWLEHNGIVCDHSNRSCIVKETGYNLLQEVKLRRRIIPSKDALREEQRNNKTLKKEAFRELVEKVKTNWAPRRAKEQITEADVVASIRTRIATIAIIQDMQSRETKLKAEFAPIFGPLPHIRDIPTNFTARIRLKDPEKKIRSRSYPSPRKYTKAWSILVQEFLDTGRIRPSNSPYASPAFLIPKADPTAVPRWVNDYRQLNANTITDSFPLPRIDDILTDCAKGIVWAKIDMTNAFFQTRLHPDDVKFTAVNTPLGLYEWLVMPQGLRNAPAIHQRRVTSALRKYIGKICYIYLDDIVIWSSSINDHENNVRKILQALQDAKLHVNPKKCELFCSEIHFLGHKVSTRGIEADEGKADRILAWPVPKSAQDVRSFLGLVRYLATFLPNLAEHTGVLTELTLKRCDVLFPQWTPDHQHAFDSVKRLVASRDCLTTIDHDNMTTNKIFVTTDASDLRSGAVLSFGPTWETARPVAFDSMTFKAAELNYPVHEKEMLAIIRALKKWRTDLIGVPFFIYTDHKTLQNFETQRDLSRRQARWMEFLSQYDGKIIYVKGEDNTVADALSRLPYNLSRDTATAEVDAGAPYELAPPSVLCNSSENTTFSAVAALTSAETVEERPPASDAPFSRYTHSLVTADRSLLTLLENGYDSDPWIKSLRGAAPGMRVIQQRGKLWFIGDRLVVPNVVQLREAIFRLAHDVLGHFGPDKSYEALRGSFYWPNMRRDLQQSYVPGCMPCQRNKSSTHRPIGPLHPLPVPDGRCSSVAMDFIGPLPLDEGYDSLLTMTDRMGSDIQIVPTTVNLTAESLAEIFFDRWYCENGLPDEIISDRDKLFMSKFWKALHSLTGVKIKASTAYHPETDGASERTNKTVIQALRYHVRRNQTGWVRALPRIRFHMMNTVNKSTKFSPFQLRFGRSPRILPPLLPSPLPLDASNAHIVANNVIERLRTDVRDAQDNLLLAKITQSAQANKTRTLTFPFSIGQRVRLTTKNRRREYKNSDGKRVAKFIARFDGPFKIVALDKENSTVTLDLPNSANFTPTFHTSHVFPAVENNGELFPSRSLQKPTPISLNGQEEHFIDHILAERRRGRGHQYLVRWRGEGPEGDTWLPRREVEDCEALDTWLAANPTGIET